MLCCIKCSTNLTNENVGYMASSKPETYYCISCTKVLKLKFDEKNGIAEEKHPVLSEEQMSKHVKISVTEQKKLVIKKKIISKIQNSPEIASFKNKTAKEIVDMVYKLLRKKITISLKSKKSIINKASKMFKESGYEIL